MEFTKRNLGMEAPAYRLRNRLGPAIAGFDVCDKRTYLNAEAMSRSSVSMQLLRGPTPVPRFVRDAMGIIARIGEREPEMSGVAREPPKRSGVFKLFVQLDVISSGDIECSAGVVFTETGRSNIAQNLVEGLAGG